MHHLEISKIHVGLLSCKNLQTKPKYMSSGNSCVSRDKKLGLYTPQVFGMFST